jgi:hypothetical protein
MKYLLWLVPAALLLVFASPVFSQNSQEDTAIRLSFLQCYAHHWKGSASTQIKHSDEKVDLKCGKFWKTFDEAERHPNEADFQPSPFFLLIPGEKPQEISFAVWNVALEELVKMSEEPK